MILPGITTSGTKNPHEEWLFRRELPAHGQGIHLKHVYSAGNYQLRDEYSSGGMGFSRELPVHRRGIHPRKGIPPGITSSFTLILTDMIEMRGNPPSGNNSRISSSKCFVLPMPTKQNLYTKTSVLMFITLFVFCYFLFSPRLD
jgi:hypothetical protein